MNELQLQTGAYRTTYKGTEILRQSTKEEWNNYGEILKRVDEAKQWAVGDWLIDGKTHYNDNVYKEAEKILGVSYNYLVMQKFMAELFGLLNRFSNLDWTHHYQVSSLKTIETVKDKKLKQGRMQWSKEPDKEKMQELLQLAENNELSVKDFKEQVDIYKQNKEREFALHNSPKMFDVFYADPPWQYENSGFEMSAENHYPTMSINELCNMSIGAIAADNAVCFMWVTNPILEDGMRLLREWGFEYKTNFVWTKKKHTAGFYVFGQHEILMIGTKGSMLPVEKFKSILNENSDDFDDSNLIHSKKPDEVYGLIEAMYPKRRYIELFARNLKNGWQSWGNEL
jgi:N6-adenosine-specific RNA methylase IME4